MTSVIKSKVIFGCKRIFVERKSKSSEALIEKKKREPEVRVAQGWEVVGAKQRMKI